MGKKANHRQKKRRSYRYAGIPGLRSQEEMLLVMGSPTETTDEYMWGEHGLLPPRTRKPQHGRSR